MVVKSKCFSEEMDSENYNHEQPQKKSAKVNNVLPLWGNEGTMNLNPLILANIQGSSYFKVSLFKLKTYHEVVDEIYYQVKHLEPWERGSRKTAGQTGMCGGVRGVGAGGIVSTAFCLLYKLYTLRLTRKQVNGLLSHADSPYIRALGFMYLRFTQPPGDLFDWYEAYLQDDEEIDVKAGNGQTMTIGQMLKQWLTKLDWFSTLFPRIPVPIQKQIESKLNEYAKEHGITFNSHENERYNPEASTRENYNRSTEDFHNSGRGDNRATKFVASEEREFTKYDRDRERERERDHYKERKRERDYGEHSSGRYERDRDRDRNRDYDYNKDKYRDQRSSSKHREHEKERKYR